MDRGKPHFSSEFVPEWCAITALALLDAAWAAHIHLSFTAAGRDLMALAVALGVTAVFASRAFAAAP
jgi:hypothetical protein